MTYGLVYEGVDMSRYLRDGRDPVYHIDLSLFS